VQLGENARDSVFLDALMLNGEGMNKLLVASTEGKVLIVNSATKKLEA